MTGVLAACGGGSDGDAKKPSQDDTSSAEAEVYTTDNFVDRMVGAIREAESTHVTLELDAGAQSISGEGDLIFGSSSDDSAMDIAYDAGAMKFTLRVVEGMVYVNYGEMTDNKFFAIDPDDTTNPLAQEFAGLLEQMDPAASYEPFKDALISVEQKGDSETIDGVDAKPYVVVIDTSKIKGLPQLDDVPPGQLPKEFTYTFFMDKDDLVRKVNFSLAGTKLSMTYEDFGEVEDITAPKPSEITDKNPMSAAA